MVKLFHDNRAIVQLLLPIIILGYFFGNNFSEYHDSVHVLRFGFWGGYELSTISTFKILGLSFVLLNGIILNTLFNRNDFFEKNSFIAVLIYVVFQTIFHSFYFLDGVLLSQTFIILMFFQLFKLSQNADGRKAVFNAAIFYGIACTLNPILLIGTPFMFWFIWVVRPFIFRESILTITGFIVPLFYAGMFSYFFDVKIGRDELSSSVSEFLKVDIIVALVCSIILVLLSLNVLIQKFQVSSIRLKKLFRMLLLLTVMLCIAVVLDFLLFKNIQNLSLLFVPLALLLPYAFGEKKIRRVSVFIFYILLIYSVCKFFVPFNDLGF